MCTYCALRTTCPLRAGLRRAQHAVIVGGGFIGLKVAAAARSRGCGVTLVESLDRLMERVVSKDVLHHFRGPASSWLVDRGRLHRCRS
ncbi:FAD-dependent oxidoreductase [Streptosporangium algeriense]|uniref:FAD-dependent oxidoreductase n=1 Tax=Streptosporangium algeriense TaxID=1682748 RepID=A0ABW3DK68_9ACTN